MCGVTEMDCSCTATISSQNSEHCKFEFNPAHWQCAGCGQSRADGKVREKACRDRRRDSLAGLTAPPAAYHGDLMLVTSCHGIETQAVGTVRGTQKAAGPGNPSAKWAVHIYYQYPEYEPCTILNIGFGTCIFSEIYMQNNMQNNSARSIFCIFCILQYDEYVEHIKKYATICELICSICKIICKIIVQGPYSAYSAYCNM